MCTVALAHRAYAGLPVVLLANRDEALDRPSTPPAWRGDVLMPRDEVAGGTWLGINRAGVVSAITNRAGHPRDPSRRSRGQVVLDALAHASAETAARALVSLDPRSVSPFHLLIADAAAAFLIVHDGDRLALRTLAPGWTVVTERSFDGPTPAREARVRSALAEFAAAPPDPPSAREILSVHSASSAAEDRLAATCVHLDELRYGTRSSTYLYVGEEVRMFHADGPPCRTPPVEIAA